jgi:hypothetical protein
MYDPITCRGAVSVYQHQLEYQLERRAGCNVDLTITDNYRSMVTVRRRRRVVDVRLHHMFLDAEEVVLDALGRYISTGEDGLDDIRAYVEDNSHKINYRPRRTVLRPVGRHYDLEEIRDEVIQRHFPEKDPPHITWGRRSPGKNKSTIKFGSYDQGKRLIRIHPKLDAAWVPRYFIRFLIYHEILHREIPAKPGNVHSDEFIARMKKFPDYGRAVQWQEDNLHRFLENAGS